MPTRVLFCLLFAAVLAAAPRATACEPALLRLILSRDVQGRFETSMQELSTILLDTGRAARGGDTAALRLHAARFLETWQALYTKVYLTAPKGHQGGAVWRSRIDALTKAAAGLGPDRLSEDLTSVHPILQSLQDHLADFYLPAPGSLTPPQEFEVLRALAADLDAALTAKGRDPARDQERLQQFIDRARRTAATGPGWTVFLAHTDTLKAAIAAGDTPLRMAPAIEKLRTATLAALWFPGGSP